MSEQKSVRLSLSASQIPCTYANTFQVSFEAGEFFINMGIGRMQKVEEGGDPVYHVEISNSVAMNPENARRLAQALVSSLNSYAEKFGTQQAEATTPSDATEDAPKQ